MCASLFQYFDYVTGARMTFTVVQPEFRMREIVPHHVRVGRRARFAVRGWVQAPAYLATVILPSRILVCGDASCHYRGVHRCPPTLAAAARFLEGSESAYYPFHTEDEEGRPIGAGAFHFSRRLVSRSTGLFRMCSWLSEQGENNDPATLLATAKWRVGR